MIEALRVLPEITRYFDSFVASRKLSVTARKPVGFAPKQRRQ